jgi:hypothetical protein
MTRSQARSQPLIEQFLQLAALIGPCVAREALAEKMSALELRVLLCMRRLSVEKASFSTSGELCSLTASPKNRISEALEGLSRRKLVQEWGTASADRRTKAFRLTDKGLRLGEVLGDRLQHVEDGLRVAMRVQSLNGSSANLGRATKAILKMPHRSMDL